MLNLYDLSVNGVKSPAFVPCAPLYVGWKLESDNTNVKQASYRVILAAAGSEPVWDTKVVRSAKSVHIPFDGALQSRTEYTLTVAVTDNHGESATASITFSTALIAEDWQGMWIKPRRHIAGWAPYLRTKFDCRPAPIRRAKLYACGLGCGEYYINGKAVSEDLIDPPFSNYEEEVYYRVYDVADLLGERNALAALLGDGWYSQNRAWGPEAMKYGDVCLLAQLEIEYESGERQIITTNTEDWTYKYSPITLNNLYGGETYDSRLETPDFASPDGDEEEWGPVIEDTTPRGELKLAEIPAIHILRTLPAVSVTMNNGVNDGAWVVDFGENIAGFAEIHIPPSPRGAQYVLRFSENISPDGMPDYRSIGAFATQCIQQDVYIARGDAEGEVWRPRFTYHGFRYMELTGYHDLGRGYGAVPELKIAVAHVIATDLNQVGTFHGANEDMNHLQTIMMSTFVSNYHGFPEDCPAREKCGWLGDAQVVCNTGIMNYDLEACYAKYLSDIRTSDKVYGVWQMIAPGKRGCGEATPLWGCAQVIIPYWMYHYYGNETAVRANWDMMEKWVAHECADAKDFVITRGLGDWDPPVSNEGVRRIPVPESSTFMFYEIAIRMDELAYALGLPTAMDYAALAEDIKASILRHFWIEDAHGYSTWGSCGVALELGLYPEGEREALLAHLLSMMENDDYAMPTGIYGNKYLVPALAECGYGDIAMRYLFNRDHASFATMMDDGATSLWEELETKFYNPRDKVTCSYNHPMHSGFAYFLYAHVGGIKPIAPGFAEFEIDPCAFTDFPTAEISHVCPYGKIEVSFVREGDKTTYTFTVPANTTCHFRAGGEDIVYGSGTYTVTV